MIHENEFNVYLRPITVDDTDDIVRWRNSEEIKRYFIYQDEFTREGHLKWMETKIKTGEVVQFIIIEKRTDIAIGSVYLRDVDKKEQKAEYGIFIGAENKKGKGYGTQAARLMIEYAFDEMKLQKLYLRVLAENERAIASYKKAGFYIENISKADVCIRGIYKDIVWMTIINQQR